STECLESDLTSITGWGRFSSLGYEGLQNRDARGLLIHVCEKSHGPPFLSLGLEINGEETEHIAFNVRSRITMFDVGAYVTEWRTDVSVGSRNLLATEYYRPIPRSHLFLAPRAVYERGERNLFLNRVRVAEYDVRRVGMGLDVGSYLGD